MTQRGFTLIELLIACLLVTAVTAAVAAIALPARHAFERTLHATDSSAGARAALERLALDVRQAGGGSGVGPRSTRPADVMPVAIPQATLDSTAPTSPGQAITVIRTDGLAPQGVLVQSIAGGSGTLALDTTARCPRVGLACGFAPGMAGVVFDEARAVPFVVASVAAGGLVHTTAGLPVGFAQGSVVAATTSTTYGIRSNADGSHRLVRRLAGGVEQPVLQNVVDFAVIARGDAIPPQFAPDPPWPTYGPGAPAATNDDPRDAWDPGENCTTMHDAAGQPVPRLALLDVAGEPIELTTAMLNDGPWCADAFDPFRFDADLLRLRSIEIRLRVETPSGALRGPVGILFRRPGTARNPARWVPDVELRLVLGLRNAQG